MRRRDFLKTGLAVIGALFMPRLGVLSKDPAHAAVLAFDSAVDGGNNGGGTGLTFAFNNVAGDIMFVGFVGDTPPSGGGFDDITGVTYDSVAMTLVDKRTTVTLNRSLYLYILSSPHTGSHNVVISCSNGHYVLAGAVSYSGASLTGQPDATTQSESSTSDASWTTSLSSIADNCWHMLVQGGIWFDTAPGVGAGTTQRAKEGAFGTWSLVDSNSAKTPAGSVSLTTTYGGSGTPIAHVMASFKPAVSARSRHYSGVVQ